MEDDKDITRKEQMELRAKQRAAARKRAKPDHKKPQTPSAADVKAAMEKARESAGIIAKHTVVPGDTLGHISKKYYDSAYHYPLIYEFNKDVIGDDPNVIVDGTVLKIPKLPEDKK
jgi:nucleoid-associated protein YgaU